MSRAERPASISTGLAVIFVVLLGASLGLAVLGAEGRLPTLLVLPDAASAAATTVSITLPDWRDEATMAGPNLPERLPAAANDAGLQPSPF